MSASTTRPPGDPTADRVLLHRFIDEGNEDAFAALMRRHGPYVLWVCRQVTAHAQDAEDVFQACFLELVRKAGSIREQNAVSGWLQTVAVRLGRKARTRREKQQRREAAVATPERSEPPVDVSWREACQILQEEIAQLPDELRLPIVLCLFRGRTQEEAAQDLDVPARTIKDRLRRGRELLRGKLVRRGVTLGVLGTLLSGSALEAAVPASLQAATATAAQASVAAAATGSAAAFSGWSIFAAAFVGMSIVVGSALAAWHLLEPPEGPPAFAAPPPAPPIAMDPPAATGPQRILRSFRGKNIDLEFFQYVGPTPLRYIKLEEEGLRITLPADKGPGDNVGLKLRYPVAGDFDLEAEFEFIQVQRPQPRVPSFWSAGVSVYCFMDSPDRDGIWTSKMMDRERGPVFAVGHRTKGPNPGKPRIDKSMKIEPSASDSGIARLRIVRKGAVFTTYVADRDEDFRMLQELAVSDATVTMLRFAAEPVWNPDVFIDVRLLSFAMTADRFVGYAPRGKEVAP